MAQGFFVTGTDTGVGKTLVACALLHAFAQGGRRAVGMKPVATGAMRTTAGLVSDDAAQLRAASNIEAPLELVNPYCFEPPIAPHLAAASAAIEISFDPIARAFTALAEDADVVVVEGVGGFCVPLNTAQDTADLALQLGLPIVLVVGMRLGCLNHALLTARAMQGRGLAFAGWVANRIDPHMPETNLNISDLRRRLAAPLLGEFPYAVSPNAVRAATLLDLPLLRC